MSNEKTIRMPSELADKWLSALRSGEYKQCRNYLSNGDGFCCIGVLQMVADGDIERAEDGDPYASPSDKWLDGHGITFLNLGHEHSFPYLEKFRTHAGIANDDGATFAAIADAIESSLERVKS